MKKMQKDKMVSHYQKKLGTMLSDQDMVRYLGAGVEQKIIKYSDLKNYNNIDQLLPNDNDYCIILIESEKNSGHWCCLTRQKNVITEFDSYGCKLDNELNYIPQSMRSCLGETPNEVKNILKTRGKGMRLEQNTEKLQGKGDPSNGIDVDTCGRHILSFILANRMGYSIKDYNDLIKRETESTGKPPDILVCDWIS